MATPTPRERAQQLIEQSRMPGDYGGVVPIEPPKSKRAVDGTVTDVATTAEIIESIRAARAQSNPDWRAGNLDPAGNIPQDTRIDVTPDPSAKRIGGSILFDQLRDAGVPTKTLVDTSRDPLAQ